MKNVSIENRFFKVAFVSGLSSFLTIVAQLSVVPICLVYWGKETYGLWLALFSLFTLLKTTGSGFVNYVGNKINLLYHQDQIALQQTLSSAIAGIIVIIVIQVILLVILISVNGIPWLLGVGVSDLQTTSQQLTLAFLVLVGTWMLGGPYIAIINKLLIPAGFMYQAQWWSLIVNMSLYIVLILSAVLNFSILQASLMFAMFRTSLLIATAIYTGLKLPDYYPWWRDFNFSLGLRDLYKSFPFTLSQLLQQGASNGIIILISAINGAAMVPLYATLRTLSNLWLKVTNILTTPLLPDIVRFHATNEKNKVIAVNGVHVVIVGAVVNLSILIAYPFIESVYNYWTVQTMILDKPLLSMLLASISLLNMGAMMNTYLNGTNQRRAILTVTAGRGLSTLVIGAILMSQIGLLGLGLAVWTGEFIALILIFYFFSRVVQTDIASVFSSRVLAPAIISLLSLHIYLFVVAVQLDNIFVFYFFSLLGVVSGAVWGWMCLSSEIKDRVYQLVRYKLIKIYRWKN